MNNIFCNLKYFINRKDVTNEEWEHFYRTRWAHDKEVRSTHGVNCILRHGQVCQTMSHVAVRVARATAGISTTLDA